MYNILLLKLSVMNMKPGVYSASLPKNIFSKIQFYILQFLI